MTELIVRQVVVERLDHPIAIGVGFGVVPVFLEHVAFGVRIASHVQPMPSPPLAELGRGQQRIDRRHRRFAAGFLLQRDRLPGCRATGQSSRNTVVAAACEERPGATDEVPAARARQDETIDVGRRPGLVVSLWRRSIERRLKRPVLRRIHWWFRLGWALLAGSRIGSPHLDPPLETGDHFVRQFPIRRHFEGFVADRLDQQAAPSVCQQPPPAPSHLPRGHPQRCPAATSPAARSLAPNGSRSNARPARAGSAARRSRSPRTTTCGPPALLPPAPRRSLAWRHSKVARAQPPSPTPNDS